MSRWSRRADAVFQGGGVKVIGLVGALTVAEQYGYRWVNVAGTSAGAMVAALVAAGYRADEVAICCTKWTSKRFEIRRRGLGSPSSGRCWR